MNEDVQQMIKFIEKTTSKISLQSKIFSPLLSSVKKQTNNYSSTITFQAEDLRVNACHGIMRSHQETLWVGLFIDRMVSSRSKFGELTEKKKG